MNPRSYFTTDYRHFMATSHAGASPYFGIFIQPRKQSQTKKERKVKYRYMVFYYIKYSKEWIVQYQILSTSYYLLKKF